MVNLFKLLAHLPLVVLHAMGSVFGVLALLRPRHRRLLRTNLKTAGLQVSLLRVGAGLGQGILELPAIWLRPLPDVTGWVRAVEGREHLDRARAAGQGIILLTPHLGCWELAGIWYAAQYPAIALYRPPPQAWVHALMKEGRERGLGATVPPDRAGVKALLSALRRGEAAFILPDQVANGGDGVWAPFLGQPVYLPVLPYRLAATTGAAVVMLVCERLPWGRGYRLRITPFDDLSPDSAAAAAAVHARIGDAVRAIPGQYLWSYRIFRRPRGVPPPTGREGTNA